MHSEHLHSPLELTPDIELFSEAGISPSGECWVVPTQVFFHIWKSPVGAELRKLGFYLRNDGKRLGASQDRVLIITPTKVFKGATP